MKFSQLLYGIFIIMTSCIDEPNAYFTINNSSILTYENIDFNNLSTNAKTFFWDFGNGQNSSEFYPTIFYRNSGHYTITLTAQSEKNKYKDEYSQTLKVIQPTDLSIRIFKNIADTPIVDRALVTLYTSYDDWIGYKNGIDSLISDNLGDVFFRNIDTIVYYIDIFKSDENGYWTNWESGYKTNKLIPDTINFYSVYLDFFAVD